MNATLLPVATERLLKAQEEVLGILRVEAGLLLALQHIQNERPVIEARAEIARRDAIASQWYEPLVRLYKADLQAQDAGFLTEEEGILLHNVSKNGIINWQMTPETAEALRAVRDKFLPALQSVKDSYPDERRHMDRDGHIDDRGEPDYFTLIAACRNIAAAETPVAA